MLGSVAWVGSGRKGCAGGASVGHGAGGFAIDDVGCDCKDGGGGLGVAVDVVAFDFFEEFGEEPLCDFVGAVVVIAVAGEVAFDFVVDCESVFVADGFDAGVFDCREGVDGMGEAGDAGREGAADVGVDECHFGGFVVVLVMHVVDDVEYMYVEAGEPVHHVVEAFHYLVVLEVFALDAREFGCDLYLGLFVHAAVDCVEEAFGEVGACAEELDFAPGLGGADAAADGVVIAPYAAHYAVVFVLDGACVDGDFGGIFTEGAGEAV